MLSAVKGWVQPVKRKEVKVASLVWDQPGERLFETGVDRGVIYLRDGRSAAWNGLIGIDEDPNSESKSYYMDGVKYLETMIQGEFSGKIKAYTYPDEFAYAVGIDEPSPGLSFYEQPSKNFNLTYRTKVGNDLQGSDYGYKIHLLYTKIVLLFKMVQKIKSVS